MKLGILFLIMSSFICTVFGSDHGKVVKIHEGRSLPIVHQTLPCEISENIVRFLDKKSLLALRGVDKQWRHVFVFKVESIHFNCETEKCFVSTYDTNDYEFKDVMYLLPIAYVTQFSNPKTMMLCGLLKNNYLDLNKFFFKNQNSEAMWLFFSILSKNNVLTSLDLNGNDIGDQGAKYLSEALKANSTLTTLHLSYNSIGAEGAKSLSEALIVNSTLTHLGLFNNNIGNKGAKYLLEALKVNSALSKIDLRQNNIDDELKGRFREIARYRGNSF